VQHAAFLNIGSTLARVEARDSFGFQSQRLTQGECRHDFDVGAEAQQMPRCVRDAFDRDFGADPLDARLVQRSPRRVSCSRA